MLSLMRTMCFRHRFVAQRAEPLFVDDSGKDQVTLLVDRTPLSAGEQFVPDTQLTQNVVK